MVLKYWISVWIATCSCFVTVTLAADVESSCSLPFDVGEATTIVCVVNRTSLTAQGCGGSPTVQFRFNPELSSLESPLCTSGSTTCDPSQVGTTCGCVNITASVYTFHYLFTPLKTHKGGGIICGVNLCFPNQPLTANHTCKSVNFDKCPKATCNKGTCRECPNENNLGGYICSCGPKYKGTHCENPDPCDPNPCQNGECSDAEGRAVCTCNGTDGGVYCDRLREDTVAIIIGVIWGAALLAFSVWQLCGTFKGRTKFVCMCMNCKQECCCCLKNQEVYFFDKMPPDNKLRCCGTQPQPDYPSHEPPCTPNGNAVELRPPVAVAAGRPKENKSKDTKNTEKHVPGGRGENKHTRTENSPSHKAAVGPQADMTMVREKSVSVSSVDNSQKPNPVPGRTLPTPASSRLPSVERNSTIEFSSPGLKALPPIKK